MTNRMLYSGNRLVVEHKASIAENCCCEELEFCNDDLSNCQSSINITISNSPDFDGTYEFDYNSAASRS